MDLGFTTAVYVVAAILFILSLGGLSAKKAQNVPFGTVFCMALAALATVVDRALDFAAYCRPYRGGWVNWLSARFKS